jgi:pyochelin biosynthesis protein PchC
VEQLDTGASLTELGLESVGALSLLAKLNARFSTSLGVSELLRLSSVAGITARMEGGAAAAAGPSAFLTCLKKGGPSRLVLFPGAGGTPLMMSPWAAPAVAGDAAVYCFDPPGHGLDARPLLTRMEDIVGGCLAELAGHSGPVVLAGYSLGGLVAFALARALAARGTAVQGIVLAQTLPPAVWVKNAFSKSSEFEAVFSEIFERGHVEKQTRAAHLDAARADFRLAEAWSATQPGALNGALQVIGASEDTFAPAQLLEGWSAHAASLVVHTIPGGHFDALDDEENRARVAAIVSALLKGLSPQPSCQ